MVLTYKPNSCARCVKNLEIIPMNARQNSPRKPQNHMNDKPEKSFEIFSFRKPETINLFLVARLTALCLALLIHFSKNTRSQCQLWTSQLPPCFVLVITMAIFLHAKTHIHLYLRKCALVERFTVPPLCFGWE